MKHKVQYYETDMMGIAHHANYIHWMEEARIDFMDRIGFPYKRMEAEGILSPVKSLQANYLKPCTFGDEVDVTVGIRDFNGVVITITYDMRVNDDPVFTGVSEHVFLDRSGRFVRMKRVMPEFCEAVEEWKGK
jgi:acyl-CoA thioester hydrolase